MIAGHHRRSRYILGKSEYVIKVNGRVSENYWLSMMRIWLQSIQKHLDDAVKAGDVDAETGEVKPGAKITAEAKLSRRLVCSYGRIYNCSGRVCFLTSSNVI